MDIENEIDTVKVIITKAKSHVQIYQIHRNLARNLISIAQFDITYHVPSLFCQKALTIDMGQTFSLTNFEGKQSGNTYYMSPLIVLLFGVVNNSIDDVQYRMNAYIWRQFEGDPGKNNITLCLLMELKIRGWLSTPNYCELTYIANNSGGKNKICAL